MDYIGQKSIHILMQKPTRFSTDRRTFIKQSALVSIGFVALSRCTSDPAPKEVLNPLALKKDPEGYLDLPEDFDYKVISKMGEKMTDGFLVPGRADGMGAFLGKDGKVLVVRNHENSPGAGVDSPFGPKNEMLEQMVC